MQKKRELMSIIAKFIAIIIMMIFTVIFSTENITPKEVVVNEKLSYVVMKEKAREKLAREIFTSIENNLTKEHFRFKLNDSLIQELEPVNDKYRRLPDEVKDSISLYNIFNNNSKIASCLKGRLDSYCCRDEIKRIINFLKEKNERYFVEEREKREALEQKKKAKFINIEELEKW